MHVILRNKKGSKAIYDTFISNKSYVAKNVSKWSTELNLDENVNWNKIQYTVFRTTTDVKLRWLQYRISHRIIATNKLLYKINIKDNPFCTFCQLEEETIAHLFFECDHVQKLWSELKKLYL